MKCKTSDGVILDCSFLKKYSNYVKDLLVAFEETLKFNDDDVFPIDIREDLVRKLQFVLDYKAYYVIDLLTEEEVEEIAHFVDKYDIPELAFVPLLASERRTTKKERLAREKCINGEDFDLRDLFVNIFEVDRYYFRTTNRIKMPFILSEQKMMNKDRYQIVENMDIFRRNFRVYSNGLFDDFNWNNVVLSGSSVLSCLTVPEDYDVLHWFYSRYSQTLDLNIQYTVLKIRSDIREKYSEQVNKLIYLYYHGTPLSESTFKKEINPFLNSDIDLYIYGLNKEDAEHKLEELISYFVNRLNERKKKQYADFNDLIAKYLEDEDLNPFVSGKEIMITRNKNAVTIIGQYPFRNIQIVTQLYEQKGEFILGYDLDCVKMFYDGTNVMATESACRAIAHGYNLIADLFPYALSRINKYTKRKYVARYQGITPETFVKIYKKHQTASNDADDTDLETYYGSTKSYFNVDSGVIIEAFEEDPNFIFVILQDGDNTIESIRSIFSFELWRQFVASRAEEPMWKNRRVHLTDGNISFADYIRTTTDEQLTSLGRESLFIISLKQFFREIIEVEGEE